MNLSQRKELECRQSRCRYYQFDCEIYHGNECKQLDGDKIPRMRLIDRSKIDVQSLRKVVPATGFKPYFMARPVDGKGERYEP